MKPLDSFYVPAVCGCDYVRDSNCQAITKTAKSWQAYADRIAREKTKAENFTWYGVLCWVESRQCFRVSFGGTPEKIF